MDDRLRDLGVGLSLANLLLLPVWSELLFTDRASYYYMLSRPSPSDYVAVILNVLLLGALFFVSARLVRRSRKKWLAGVVKISFVAVVLIVVNIIRFQFTSSFGIGELLAGIRHSGFLIPAVILGACFVIAAIRFRRLVFQILIVLLLFLAPFAVITTAQALVKVITTKRVLSTVNRTDSKKSFRNGPRVVWIIFDELDESMMFTHRPAGLALPSFDSFKKSAIKVNRAHSPSNRTMISIPALLTGTPLLSSQPKSFSELLVMPEGTSRAVSISTLANVFSRAKQAGSETTAVGWYHPYCRLFQNSLDYCSWQPIFQVITGRQLAEDKSVWSAMVNQLAAISPFNPHRLAIQAYLRILEDAKKAVGHSGLIFLHFPIPHPPAIFNRNSQTLTSTIFSNLNGYDDNLSLVDRTLGELQNAMAKNGEWDRTAIIISSDHPWRYWKFYDGKPRLLVPFLVKMPGQSNAVTLEVEFSTIKTADLIMAILNGEVQNATDVAKWIETHPH